MKQWDKAAVYRLLTERGIWHEITEHPAVYNMEEMAAVDLPYPRPTGRTSSSGTIRSGSTTSSPSGGYKRVDLKALPPGKPHPPLEFCLGGGSVGQAWALPPGLSPRLGLLGREGGSGGTLPGSGVPGPPGLIGVHPNDTPPPFGCGRRTSSPCCGTTAPPSAWCRCKGALVLALALLGKVRALTRSMEEICDQLADRLQGDTNNLLTLTLAFPGEGPPQTP